MKKDSGSVAYCFDPCGKYDERNEEYAKDATE